MHPRGVLPLLVVFLSLILAPLGVLADGVIVVDPPLCDFTCPEPFPIGDQLDVRSHRVDVTIADQIATTKIDQVFYNPNDWVAEGTYLFPIPEEATVSDFTMWVDGEPVEAKILDAAEARRVYDDIVRQLRDPALLEYAGQGAIQASVFPIPPGEERRIEIEYAEVLTVRDGLVHYVYPLNTERFSAQPLQQVSVRVAVESRDPVRAIYSPSHDIAVDRDGERAFVAGWEVAGVTPATDFELYYSLSAERISTSLLSTYDEAAGEGFFLLLAAPGIDSGAEVIAKDVIVVLDTSGSMEGEKIVQAKSAVTYILEHLNPEDRFAIVEFSTGARIYNRSLEPSSASAKAIPWVKRLMATGGTDINLALLEGLAMAETERPTTLLFLTDGLPTEGETDPSGILANVAAAAPANVRLFAFGVGDDVDTFLLDSLAAAHHGTSTYVRPGQAVDETVSAFYAGISSPVLANLEVDFGDVIVEELYPEPLPDLFAGGQLVLIGRYREGGPATITLSGEVNGERQSFSYDGLRFATNEEADFLPRLWATRRIGYLLNQIRLQGEQREWVDAIVDLSVRYGIVTPYTSYLITEEDILSAEGRTRVANDTFDALQNTPPPPSSGAAAVNEAQNSGQMAAADVAQAPAAEYGEQIRLVGDRAFVLLDGVWTETTFDPESMTPIEVPFASDEYFALLSSHPDLAAAFALGQGVIAISDGLAYQVVPVAA